MTSETHTIAGWRWRGFDWHPEFGSPRAGLQAATHAFGFDPTSLGDDLYETIADPVKVRYPRGRAESSLRRRQEGL